MAGGALANAAGREADAVCRQPLDGKRQVVDPKTDMIERCGMHGGLLFRVERLHQVDFDAIRPGADRGDVLIDVFAFRNEIAGDCEAELVHPQRAQAMLGQRANGDLLDSEHAKRTSAHASTALPGPA